MLRLRAALIGATLFAGCNVGVSGVTGGGGPGDGGLPGIVGGGTGGPAGPAGRVGTGGMTGTSGVGTTTAVGIPCAVNTVLRTRCQTCHSSPPVNGAPMPLVTLADLRAPARTNAAVTTAQLAATRMNSTTAPMPPRGQPAATPSEIQTITDWVAASAPEGAVCGAGTTTTTTTTTTIGTGGSSSGGSVAGSGGNSGAITGTGGAPAIVANGFPCDVQALLQTRCVGCHGATPINGAPMSLVTYANLTAASIADPTMTFAQRVLVRIQNNTSPMPPAPNARATAAEIMAMSNWIAARYPMGTCAAPTTTGTGGASGTGTGGVSGGATNTGGTTGGVAGTGGSSGTVANGIPCDVQALLQGRCLTCHTSPPANGAPMSLVTYANLTAASLVDASMTFAQRAVARMQNNTSPMPPAPNARATAAEITAMNNWITARYPMGACATIVTGTGGRAGGTGGVSGTGGSSGAGGGAVSTAGGVPCDVQAVFQTHCTTCHAATPNSGAPMPLVTRANLVSPSAANAAMTFAQRAVMRMQGNPSQMPPAPGAPVAAAEIQTVASWVAAGYPTGTCTTTTPIPDPFTVAARCTSNTFWTGGNTGSPLMNPGRSCLSCHTGGGGGGDSGGGNSGPGGGGDDNGGGGGDDNEAPLYTIAGTVYPTAHEPDLCNGSNGTNGARVVIVDAANRTITLTPNAAGNFFYDGAVSFPFHAKVTFQGRERIMTAAQSNGSCNGCHTQNGANGAPGRILLP